MPAYTELRVVDLIHLRTGFNIWVDRCNTGCMYNQAYGCVYNQAYGCLYNLALRTSSTRWMDVTLVACIYWEIVVCISSSAQDFY